MATKKQLAAFKKQVTDITGVPFSKIHQFKLEAGAEIPGGYIMRNHPAGILFYTEEFEHDASGQPIIPAEDYGDPDCWEVGLQVIRR